MIILTELVIRIFLFQDMCREVFLCRMVFYSKIMIVLKMLLSVVKGYKCFTNPVYMENKKMLQEQFTT